MIQMRLMFTFVILKHTQVHTLTHTQKHTHAHGVRRTYTDTHAHTAYRKFTQWPVKSKLAGEIAAIEKYSVKCTRLRPRRPLHTRVCRFGFKTMSDVLIVREVHCTTYYVRYILRDIHCIVYIVQCI